MIGIQVMQAVVRYCSIHDANAALADIFTHFSKLVHELRALCKVSKFLNFQFNLLWQYMEGNMAEKCRLSEENHVDM